MIFLQGSRKGKKRQRKPCHELPKYDSSNLSLGESLKGNLNSTCVILKFYTIVETCKVKYKQSITTDTKYMQIIFLSSIPLGRYPGMQHKGNNIRMPF